MRRVLLVLSTPLALTACASAFSGTSDEILVTTEPTHAACELRQGDRIVGHVPTTPGMVRVGKTNKDIEITCTKGNELTGSAVNKEGTNPWFIADLALIPLGIGIFAVAIDISTHAIVEYDDTTFVELKPTAKSGTDLPGAAPAGP